MIDLSKATDKELREELERRGTSSMAECPTCHKWQTYVGAWDSDGRTIRCYGCKRAVHKCTCR